MEMSHACHRFLKCQKTLTFCSLLAMCRIPCTCHAKPHLNLQNVVRACRALYILTSKCASRHKGVCFFDISTSKHASNPSAFSTFHFQMCFAPQRRAIFRYLNFQKCSEHIRARCALYVLTSTCASRHDGVHFFDISTFKSAARLKCFVHFDSEMCSRHKGVHFFQHLKISTSKIAPQPSAFYTIHFQMCFAPQRHAIFRYLNFQKCSEHRAHPSTVCFVRFDFDMCFAPRWRALCRHLNFQKCSEAEVFCAF